METRARASYNPAMGMETIVALFMVGFVIEATPGPGVFATVGRALFQGFGPTLLLRSERAMRRLDRGAGTVLIGAGGAMASS